MTQNIILIQIEKILMIFTINIIKKKRISNNQYLDLTKRYEQN